MRTAQIYFHCRVQIKKLSTNQKKKKTEKKVENPQPLIECPLEIFATGRDNMVEDITQQVNWILGNEGDICMHPKEKKKETVLDHVSMIESCENGVESCEVLPEEKKKRKRRRKKSQHQTTLEAIDSGSKQDIPLNYEYLTPPFAERKHIHFDNQQDINATEEINQTQNSQVKQYDEQNHFSNSLKSLSNDRNSSKSENIVNDFKATSKPLSNISLPTNFASYLPSPCVNKKSMLTDSITNVPSQFGALLALKTRPTVFSRQPSEKTKVPENQFHYQYPTDTPPESVPVEEESSVSEFNPNTYPLCVGPPRKGDIVAYKVLELSANYNPEVSDYRRGRITEIKPNGELAIEIIGNPISKKCYGGKFEIIEDDEGSEEEFETEASYHWNELIEPRLIFP